ncbi:MAG: hybrid sensor histidine kinase/response regulator [Cyanobacteria bacterium P01_F01_bin.86]
MTYTSPDLGDLSMLDLFRMEVETQVDLLNNTLLEIENQPHADEVTTAKQLEDLMRAAHSIKGAARIVGLDPAVKVAHVMEDCFVAAQKGQIHLNHHHIDVLLGGVDWFTQLHQFSAADLPQCLEQQSAIITELATTIAALLTAPSPSSSPSSSPSPSLPASPPAPPSPSAPSPSPSAPAPSPSPSLSPPAPPSTPSPQPSSSLSSAPPPSSPSPSKNNSNGHTPSPVEHSIDRVVRVSARNLNRLMALAGESVVEANWLQPFTDSMLHLKRQQQSLSRLLDQLQEEVTVSSLAEQQLLEAQKTAQDCYTLLSERLGNLEQFSRRFIQRSDDLYQEVVASHMRPFADGVQGFPRMVRDVAKQSGKSVKLEILGQTTQVDRDILEKLEVPLTHMLQNAIAHGIETPEQRQQIGKPETGTIRLEASHRAGMLSITVSDDGQGIDIEDLRQRVVKKRLTTSDLAAQLSEAELMEFLFLPGFSTAAQVTEMAGRGVGLDIAKSMVQDVGGLLRAVSQPGEGLTFHFQLPLTLSVIRALLVEISGEPYAFGLNRIDQVLMVDPQAIAFSENRPYIVVNNENLNLVKAQQVLELPETTDVNLAAFPVVILSDYTHRYGVIVDRFLGERDLVVRSLDPRLGKIQDINAAALTEEGLPLLSIDVADFVRSIDQLVSGGDLRILNQETATNGRRRQKRVLVVDDSITVREMERKLLQNQGYQVDVAVNGMEGWNTVRSDHYDLVISDIDMPRMNGIELVRHIKDHSQLRSIPVIIVSYKDRQEDQIAGLEAGADYYLTKGSFHDNSLLNAVVELIGE